MYSKRASNTLLVIALIGGALFLHRYLGVFALAALTAIVFTPLHDWLKSRKGRISKSATFITIVTVVLSLLLPIFTLAGLAFYEGKQVVDDIKDNQAINSRQVESLSSRISSVAGGVGVNLSRENIKSKIDDFARKVIPGLIEFIFKTTGSIAAFVASAIVYFAVLATMLSRKYELINLCKRLSPFDERIDDEYLSKVKSMAISMVKGTFIIAVVVGLISAVSLWIIGFPYIIFWFMLFTLMSLIPLGAGIIYVPIGIIMLLTGNIWEGILILITQFVILNNVDNVLRPKLAPKDSRLPGALVLVSVFAGVSYFGILGVVYGPVIMVLIYTTIEIYDRHRTVGMPLKAYILAK